jgi:hypothetical protein
MRNRATICRIVAPQRPDYQSAMDCPPWAFRDAAILPFDTEAAAQVLMCNCSLISVLTNTSLTLFAAHPNSSAELYAGARAHLGYAIPVRQGSLTGYRDSTRAISP